MSNSTQNYRRALVALTHLVMGRKVALRSNSIGIARDPWKVFEVAEESLKEDARVASPDDKDFGVILRQVSRKLEALEDLRTLAQALDELDPQLPYG